MRLLLCLLLLPLTLRAEDPPEPNYVFWAKLVRIVDGNNLAMDLDLGFGVWVHNQTLTLLDPDNTVLSDPGKEKNMERVKKIREVLDEGTDIVVRTIRDKDARPPRYFAEIWVDGVNLNENLKKSFP